ncbi:transcription antitermination factor NusB [Swingsia samuiensis]|uniref:Transcription antitermination protein NusB n=1 Tax=Swingsia samuiensis TaxID=1293412 RepID=A0A4Y6ULF8_9PROT|nr:transcription antitermination factor NusB [Swingsia samuiensis]QDH17904.1 transcription antitermination factor NusB [Swingsia samuiensis]
MTSSEVQKKRPTRRSRTIARVAAVQALFQCEQSEETAETVINQFLRHRQISSSASFEDGHIPDADLKLLQEIVKGTTLEQDKIDHTLSDVLPTQWPLPRLDPVLRALLRAATYEIINTNTDNRIIINEYLDVAHGFFFGDEPKLVNGILDTLNRRQEGNS